MTSYAQQSEKTKETTQTGTRIHQLKPPGGAEVNKILSKKSAAASRAKNAMYYYRSLLV